MSRVEYDPIPEPSAAQWDRQANEADDRNDREAQARVDNRLTREELNVAIGCLSTYILQMGRDVRRPDATVDFVETLSKEIRLASEAMSKLMEARI
jgi:hypothetical protein